ncbi:ADP-ribosyltransferase [Salinicoccus kekensis]|nr:ADP-ribosyltransferase [Salinicoccus kekensis]
MRHALRKWLPRLNSCEKTAIIDYTDVHLYRLVNQILRSSGINGSSPSFIIKMINNIDSGLRKFKFNTGFTAYRRVSEEEYIFLENNETINSFADFKSTTILKDIALDFSQDETKHIILVQLPPFVNGAYIAPLSIFKDEKEFLLNKGTKYQIIDKLYVAERNIKYLILKVV